MPAWVMHLKTAKELNKVLKLDEQEFLVGNVMPDAEIYVIDNLSIRVKYDVSHCAEKVKINGFTTKLPDYGKFAMVHKADLKNPVTLGYLVHLMTDYFWNEVTFSNYFITDNAGNVIGIKLNFGEDFFTDKETIREYKQFDFEMFSRKIYKDLHISIDASLADKIRKDSINIKEVPYSREDIEKIISYLNNIEDSYSKKEYDAKKYRVFTEDIFNKYFDESIKFVLNELKKLKVV